MDSAVATPRLWNTGPVVVVHGLSCSAVCGIFPDQGWNLCLLHSQSLYHSAIKEAQINLL